MDETVHNSEAIPEADNAAAFPEQESAPESSAPAEADPFLTDDDLFYNAIENSAASDKQEEVREEVSPYALRKNTKEAVIAGAILGAVVAILMFLTPSRILNEGARFTICVILILLGPRLAEDKYHLDFRKGRIAMAASLVLILVIYILIGHPIN